MSSSVSRWLSSLHKQPAASDLSAAQSGPSIKTPRRPLSAQSTLESISTSAPGKSEASPASTTSASPGIEHDTLSSLGPLFACVSPYLSTADVRLTFPLRRLYDPRGPVVFGQPPLQGVRLHRGELRLWDVESERIISQNSSNRRVHRALWTSTVDPLMSRPAALKFVEDTNPRDGRSLKREIECHVYVYQKLPYLYQLENELRSSQVYSFTKDPQWAVAERLEDVWPSAELFGYHLDKKNPGRSVLLTRKLSGPDLFDVIRAEHNHNWHFHHPANSAGSSKCHAAARARWNGVSECAHYPWNYEYHKLRWCALALRRLGQYASLSIRHNDVKPDNIVLDFFQSRAGHRCLDVKLIDLGTASMHNAKDFTGGTSWYESPEQKLLEYFMKKRKNADAARRVDIDLPSDLWGAGISLAEVLVGRRVVDSLKPPHGPGSLEYLGFEAYRQRAQGRFSHGDDLEADAHGDGGRLENYPFWALDPGHWALQARKALGLDKDAVQVGSLTKGSLAVEAARWVFSSLVKPCPETRTSLMEAMNRLERFAEESLTRSAHLNNSFTHNTVIHDHRTKPS